MSENPGNPRKRKRLDEIEITGALATRRTADGRRKIKLREDEREMFARQEKIERAVAMFLDTQAEHTWEEIAKDLGMTVRGLRDLTKTQAFMDAYDAHFAELGHDPRLRSAQAALTDLLPLAVRELRSLLTGPMTPPSVKMKAIEKVIELNGIAPTKGGQMDRVELTKFLQEAGIVVHATQNNYIQTSPFDENIRAYTEGKWSNIESHQASDHAMVSSDKDNLDEGIV